MGSGSQFPRRRAALSGAFVVLGALVAFACGGSSSETPPPLEPLPLRLRAEAQPPDSVAVPSAQGPAPSAAVPSAAVPSEGAAERSEQPAAVAPTPNGSATPTWGR